MLKRIATDQVRLGMYVQGFEGSWFDHPFWRARFLIENDGQLTKIQQSAVDAVIIDVAKGQDVDAAPAKAAPGVVQAVQQARKSATQRIAQRVQSAVVNPAAQDKRDLARAEASFRRTGKAMTRVFEGVRAGKTVRDAEVQPVVGEIIETVQRNARAFLRVARLKTQSEYTYLHSVSVCGLMATMALELELPEADVHTLGMAGLLHDIGKMSVSPNVLDKPGKLTDEEFDWVRSHPDAGHDFLSESGDFPDTVLDVCRHHHERPDGKGYPFGLADEKISLAARLGAICDVYDALTSDRAYKAAWTPIKAVSEMWQWDGQFDRSLLFRFLRAQQIFPPGALVRLRTNRLGVVLEPPRGTTLPRVAAFYAIGEGDFIDPQTVTISDRMSDDQIVSIEDPLAWPIAGWEERVRPAS